jgi:hypothetical protein
LSAFAPVARADDANPATPPREPHGKNSITHLPEAIPARFGLAVSGIGQNHPPGIGKRGDGFNESDTVLGEIGNVPFKMFAEILQTNLFLKLQLLRLLHQIADA